MRSFQHTYETTVKAVMAQAADFPWENKKAYAAWLAETFYFVRYSTRMLSLAAGSCSLDQTLLHQRYLAHTKEETGHEMLAVNDLKFLGYTPYDFPERPEIRSFYQSQFYYIQNEGCHQFMGWICFLEGIAMRVGPIVTQRALVHGPQAVRFLKLHGEEDAEHINSAFKVLKSLSEEEMKEVERNFLDSAERYKTMMAWAASQASHSKAA